MDETKRRDLPTDPPIGSPTSGEHLHGLRRLGKEIVDVFREGAPRESTLSSIDHQLQRWGRRREWGGVTKQTAGQGVNLFLGIHDLESCCLMFAVNACTMIEDLYTAPLTKTNRKRESRRGAIP